MTDKKVKVYLTRDEGSNKIFVWKKPSKGNWSPVKLKECEIVNYQREDIENMDYYLVKEFKKKFGFIISPRIKKCCHLPYDLLHSEDYKLISNDPDRKK